MLWCTMRYEVRTGDSLLLLRDLPADSVDAVVTDPPYGLRFMGKRWDYDVPTVPLWAEVLRVLKPGGHLLAFAGTRTQHRMAVRIEDAGFEIRDMIAWVYGSGFPKSLDVSKELDKRSGYWCGRSKAVASSNSSMSGPNYERTDKGDPITEAARDWQGWGTALKPSIEPITVARKPLAGTVAETVLAYGTGALNIDGCRVPGGGAGRWPANLIHDGSDEATAAFPESTSGVLATHHARNGKTRGIYGQFRGEDPTRDFGGDTGSAARFYYCAKATQEDRDDGCRDLPMRSAGEMTGDRDEDSAGLQSPRAGAGRGQGARNHHPTVKPTALMRYLCRLVTPPGGLVLDPFTGSGSTGRGAVLEGLRFLGCELDPEFAEIARRRIAAVEAQQRLL